MFTRKTHGEDHQRFTSEQSAFSGNYQLSAPGPGLDLPFFDDPFLRMQQWGGNLAENPIAISSDLRGLTRRLCRDQVDENQYQQHAVAPVSSSTLGLPLRIHGCVTDQSRTTHPAWMYRVNEQNRWEEPLGDPQSHVERPFHSMISTRILEQNVYRPSHQRFPHLNDR